MGLSITMMDEGMTGMTMVLVCTGGMAQAGSAGIRAMHIHDIDTVIHAVTTPAIIADVIWTEEAAEGLTAITGITTIGIEEDS